MFHTEQKIGVYTLVKRLGRGGFGEVWLGERHGKFATTQVTVKLPLDEQVDHAAIEHEAQLWAKASGHPNVLPIIEADEYDGQIFIVSEYAPDGSLEDWLKTHGKMPVEKAVQTTIQILDGLEFLHSRQIIHRDLKPANILLQGKTPRLADFGISRAMRTTAASQSQNISGTFAYMSPEALDGKRSVQTDIWSVGVNLYQFLTGTLPFPQKEPSVLFPAIIMREFTLLPDSIPQSLKNVVAKSLAKQSENRYQTTAEMRDELQKVLFNIAHPTHTPTEILQIPLEILPTVATVENRLEASKQEKEAVFNQPPDVPSPTQGSFPQESVVTKFDRISLAESKSLSLEAQKFADQTRHEKTEIYKPEALSDKQTNSSPLITIVFVVTILGLITWGILTFVNYLQNEQIMPIADYTNTANTKANANINASQPFTPHDEIIVEIKPLAYNMHITSAVDGKKSSEDILATTPKIYTGKQSVRISYYSGFTADKIQITLNGKQITPPSAPAKGSSIVFEINKENIAQILQSGQIK